MLPRRIGIASRSGSVELRDLIKVAAALNLQIARDLQPIWNISASVTALADPESIEPGVWPIFIVDDVGHPGADGIHLTEHQQPYALVHAGRTWSLTASHECLEMLVDPSGNWLVPSAAIAVVKGEVRDLPGAKFEYLVEVADPSEDPANAYMIDDILVSDFYTPRFFDPIASGGVRYSFTGRVTRPREVLPNGYISWLNPRTGGLQQLRWMNRPEIVDLPGQIKAGPQRPLRGQIDEQTRSRARLSNLAFSASASHHQAQRADWVQTSSALRSAAYVLARQPGLASLPSPAPVQKVLDANQAKLKVAGATKAYVGWHFENGWITRTRAIVVLARATDVASVRSKVPIELKGIPVEVRRDPRPPSKSAGLTAVLLSAQSGTIRSEYAVPVFPGEKTLEAESPDDALLLAANTAKPKVPYTPPNGVSLKAVTEDVTLVLHVSPEQGWAQLKPFLEGIKKSLVVGIYEFTAPHIDATVRKALPAPEKLTLTLDSPGEPMNKREQTVEDTHDHLSTTLKKRLSFAWALSGLGREAPATTFPTAYHIKVAVRDSNSFWLSSGNWNSSNQPDVDPSDLEALAQAATTHDRDWHVICDSETLAKVFQAYLEQDFKTARTAAAQTSPAALLAAASPLPQAELVTPAAFSARKPERFFAPRVVKAKVKIKPLLTPDDYRKPMLELIRSAKKRFFMQTQYIHAPGVGEDSGSPTHLELITAVADLINAGVDVRLITSEFQTTQWIERLQDAGVDAVEHLRIQPKVHNKGIVVDSEIVVVSSQNWSAQGTGANRDAGLIIFNSEAAQYFEEIFLHDWVNLAKAKAQG